MRLLYRSVLIVRHDQLGISFLSHVLLGIPKREKRAVSRAGQSWAHAPHADKRIAKLNREIQTLQHQNQRLRKAGIEGRKYSDYWRLANPLFDDPKHSVVFLRKANDLRAPGQAAQSQGARSCPAADSEPLGERAASCVVVEVGSKTFAGTARTGYDFRSQS